MKRSREFVNKRRQEIMKLLEQNGQFSITALSKALQVSPLTIRRDIQHLESMQLAKHHYGYVTINNPYANSFSSNQVQCKQSIARYAAKLVDDNATIMLNTSSTALALLKFITAEHVTVITNNAQALNIDTERHIDLILTGGELRSPKCTLTGDFAIQNLKQVTANIAFIGCSGISPEGGISTSVIQEGSINLQMMRQAAKVIVLADHTKIGHISHYRYSEPHCIDVLITDEQAPKVALNRFRRMGIEVVTVDAAGHTSGTLSSTYTETEDDAVSDIPDKLPASIEW